MKIILLTLFTLGITFNAQAETWKFATEEAKGDVQDIYAQKFAEVVNKETNGEVDVKIYYYGDLGTESDAVELTTLGEVQFVSVGTGHLGKYVPEVQAISLPYLLGTDSGFILDILTNSKTIYKDLAGKFENVNLKLLSLISEGEMIWGANKAIRKPSDFIGQKIRTFTSTLPVETYKAFGATPVPLSWGKVYDALKNGEADGMMNPPYFIYAAKWYEVQDYLIFPGNQVYIASVSTNNQWFNQLSTTKQGIIKKAIDEADQAASEYELRINQEFMRKMIQERPGIEIIRLSNTERSAFKQASLPLYNTFYEVVEAAYPEEQKKQARIDAQIIVYNLINEVFDAKLRGCEAHLRRRI
jgi:TRAP-type C4-dicarboxylate transport system substrate-binding protein